MPICVSSLTALSQLSLGYNNIVGLPQWLMCLSNLQSLDLNGNGVVSLPDCMFGLSQLTHLSLSSNKLTEVGEGAPAAPLLCEVMELHQLHKTRLCCAYVILSMTSHPVHSSAIHTGVQCLATHTC